MSPGAPIPRDLRQGPWFLDDYKNYRLDRTINVLFLNDPLITHTDTCVEDRTPPDRGDIWPLLTPVRYDDVAGGWRIWEFGFSIEGFLIGKTGMSTAGFNQGRSGRLQLLKDDCVMGLVGFKGEIQYESIPLPPGQTQANLDLALASATREDGMFINGLPSWH